MATPHTPTGVTIYGILIDGNRISRREYTAIVAAIQASNDIQRNDELTGELVEKLVVAWPFEQPITKDGYLNLPLPDSLRVDQAITEYGTGLGEKKSSLPSKQPENSNGQLTTTN